MVFDILVSRTLNIVAASVLSEFSPQGRLFKNFEAAKYFFCFEIILSTGVKFENDAHVTFN